MRNKNTNILVYTTLVRPILEYGGGGGGGGLLGSIQGMKGVL